MMPLLDMPKDISPQKGGWAPGQYLNQCSQCGAMYIGDKRSCVCSGCAYGDDKAMDDMFAKAAI